MPDLEALEATATGFGPSTFRPVTPLSLAAWEQALKLHPDQSFVHYILSGIKYGFHIGADRASLSLKPATGNLPSVHQHPQLVQKHITEEVSAHRLLGPLPDHLVAHCHASPIGLIPKPHQPGKWRLIVDLSSPRGNSVNDGIAVSACHMHYSSVLDAATMIRELGPGTLLAKMDLHQAYRNIPVHADDHPLQAIRWGQHTYVDTALPFGLRSVPKRFSAVADTLAWVMSANGVTRHLHYLDDFLFLGPPNHDECASSLHTALQVCSQLGVPVANHKTEGPTTKLTFLGIQIDTEAMQLRLAQDKLTRISAIVFAWRSK